MWTLKAPFDLFSIDTTDYKYVLDSTALSEYFIFNNEAYVKAKKEYAINANYFSKLFGYAPQREDYMTPLVKILGGKFLNNGSDEALTLMTKGEWEYCKITYKNLYRREPSEFRPRAYSYNPIKVALIPLAQVWFRDK